MGGPNVSSAWTGGKREVLDGQREVAEAAEGEAAVPAGEAAPAVVEGVVIGFCADVDGNEFVLGSANSLQEESLAILAGRVQGGIYTGLHRARRSGLGRPTAFLMICSMSAALMLLIQARAMDIHQSL